MAADELRTEVVAEPPAFAPDPAPPAATAAGLSPVEGSVIGLSRQAGNAAVAHALEDDTPAAGMAALGALARSRRRRGPDGAATADEGGPGSVARQPVADTLGAGFRDALLQRATAHREGGTSAEPSPGPAKAIFARLAVAREETAVDATAAEAAATAAYDALDGLDDVDALLAALTGYDADTRWAVRMAFQDAQGYSLGSYLVEQLSGDDLVRAAALLEASSVHEDHVALGLALIPAGTRESEVFRVLEGTPAEARPTLAARYDAAFGSSASTGALGYGSLASDLANDLDEEDAYRATTLLQRDLTPGDRLYLASLAIAGTREDECVEIVQTAWRRGPDGIAELETQWGRTPATVTLRDAMTEELGGEALGLVRAVLDAYDAVASGGAAASGGDAAARDLVEAARFDAAYATYGAAAEGLGTNETQAGEAVEQMRRLIEDRTARVRAAGLAEGADPVLSSWQTKLAGLDLEEELGGVELQRVELQRGAALEPADELYLAMRDGEDEAAVQIVTKAWAEGKVDGLEEACRTERVLGDQVRPAFSINDAVSMRSSHAVRLWTLANHDHSLVERGARRLAAELDEGSSEADLGRALQFLELASPELRGAVLERFVANRELPGDGTAGARFSDYVRDRYGDTPLVVDARDLVDPVSAIEDPRARLTELLRRGRDRHELSQPGVFFSLPVAAVLPGAPTAATVGDLVREYDTASGNDVFAVSDESLARLQWIVEQATDDELAGLAAERGITVDEEAHEKLATGEYGRLKERLSEVDELVRTVTEALATAVELAVSAAITAATGGAAAGLFAAAMASAIAGMLVREAALGDRYELASKENAEKLVTIALGAALGAMGGKLLEGAGALEKLQAMGRLGAFAGDAAQEAFTQVGNALAAGMFADRIPHAEDVALNALAMLVAVGASGTGGSIRFGLEDAAPLAEQLRTRFVANLTAGLMNGSAELGTELGKGGTGHLTGVDILGLAGRKGLMATAGALTATLGETGAAQSRAADAAAAAEREASEDAAAGETRGEPGPDEHEATPPRPVADEAEDALGTIDPGSSSPHPPGDASWPDGLVHYGLTAAEAHSSYEVSIAGQGADEVGVWHNLDTGEHVVVQGNSHFVSGDFRSDPTFAEGRWVAVRHYHPSGEYHARFPSLQDYRYLAAQALRNRPEGEHDLPYTASSIDYVDAKGQRQTTEFGFDGNGEWFVRYVDFDGERIVKRFTDAPHGPNSEYVRYLYDRGIPVVDATSAPEGDLATVAPSWEPVRARIGDDTIVDALATTDATPETVARLLDVKGVTAQQIGQWALHHGEAGLRVVAALAEGGVPTPHALRAVAASRGVAVPATTNLPGGTLLELVLPLVETGRLRNALGLARFLEEAHRELSSDRAGRAQELTNALQAAVAGDEVQLGGGADVVVHHAGGGGEAVQHKNLTTPDEVNVAFELRKAIGQLAGKGKEFPPGHAPTAAPTDPRYLRVVDLRLRRPAAEPSTLPASVEPYRLHTADRATVLAFLVAETAGYDTFDEVRFTNDVGTFTFARSELVP